jgi:hypothetical protein
MLVRWAWVFVFSLVAAPAWAQSVNWADSRAHDKGCRGTDHIFHVRCERSDQDWSDRCPNMVGRRNFRDSPMSKDPIRLADRAWSEVAIADGACATRPASHAATDKVDWADSRALDKGCRGWTHVFHVRCEFPDGSASQSCPDMPTRSFLGSSMYSGPSRLPDRAWTEVYLSDGTCSPLPSDTAKARCRQKCDDALGPAVANSLENGGGSEAGVVIVACHGVCEAKRHVDVHSVGWYEKWAEPKECAGPNRVYNIPCTDGDGVWVEALGDKDKCPALPNSYFGKTPLKVQDINGLASVWKRFEIPHDSCKADWADARAHDKGCRGTSHIFHAACERPDRSYSLDCSNMPTRQFRGSTMTTAPVRLGDKAWTEVAISDATCSVGWADARAHDKGCRGTSHIFHVRCERPDGGWSLDCSDLPTRQFRGSTMTTTPVRLGDRTWTEVAISDATCDPKGLALPRPPSDLPKPPPPQPVPPPTPLPKPKESPPTTGTVPTTKPQMSGPSPETTAVAKGPPTTVTSTTTLPSGSPSNPPKEPNDTLIGPAIPNAPPQTSAPACDAAKVTQCKGLIQGVVPWQMSPEPQYRQWAEGNLDNLCRCTRDAAKTVQCFQDELYRSNGNNWATAIELCKAR